MDDWTLRITAGIIVLAIGLLTRWVWTLKTNEMHGLGEDVTLLKTELTTAMVVLKTEVTTSIAGMKADLTGRIDRMEKSFKDDVIRQDDIGRAQTAKIHERLDEHINELHVKTGS